jgi:hypothetical protein
MGRHSCAPHDDHGVNSTRAETGRGAPRFAFTALAGLVLLAAAGQRAAGEGERFYERQIRPILKANCFRCHSHAAGKAKGGLVVDSPANLLRGGDSGPAIVPGAPEKSLLIRAVRHTDPDLQMPPSGKKLAEAQVALLSQWVKMGAPAPGLKKTGKDRRGRITAEDRAWWAFQPVRSPPVPVVADDGWSRNEIDRFLFQKLAAAGLKPAPEAGRQTLIRRVYFDLVGLPPTPGEVDAFLADPSPQAYEKLIDRLLASPHYGERWARHWLDLARYAESDGFRIDEYRPTAWRYRDYVIRSFNQDKPYNRLVAEQLAGDELAPDDPEALTGTAFLRHTIYEYNQRDVRTQWADMLNDLTDVTGDVFLGLGLGCARCHDHKFDPILQQDYYRLQAFFTPFLPRDDVPLATAAQRSEYRTRLAKWEEMTAPIRRQLEAIEAPHRRAAARDAIAKFPDDIQAMLHKAPSARAPLEQQLAELAYRQVLHEFKLLEGKLKGGEKQRHAEFKRQLAAFDRFRPAPLPAGLSVTDVGPVAPPTLVPKKPRQRPVEPGLLAVLDDQPAVIGRVAAAPRSTGRRTALARWLTRPDHPLTTRVIVNRVWQYHFGRGLVATASDFGRLGQPPTHPGLLDWLATRFVRDGWSFKKMHRLILTSSAYRQSATAAAAPAALRRDPENRLLWRGGTRRLDAEQIRDALLAATGELDLRMGGPGALAGQPRRTIYTKVLRNRRDPLLDVFDSPEGFTSTAQRNVTTTATQALLLFNSRSLLQRAQALAARLTRDGRASDGERVTAAYRLAYGRRPTAAEQGAALAFLREQAGRARNTADPHAAALADFCHVLLNSNEFLYLD